MVLVDDSIISGWSCISPIVNAFPWCCGSALLSCRSWLFALSTHVAYFHISAQSSLMNPIVCSNINQTPFVFLSQHSNIFVVLTFNRLHFIPLTI